MTRFARADEVSEGTRLIAGSGFDCIREGKVVTVQRENGGLFVPCSHGRHFIDGQLDQFGNYVGLSIVDLAEAA
jgi:hypothetical protein